MVVHQHISLASCVVLPNNPEQMGCQNPMDQTRANYIALQTKLGMIRHKKNLNPSADVKLGYSKFPHIESFIFLQTFLK